MKRLCIIASLLLLLSTSYAEIIDLYSLEYDDKLALYQQLQDYFDKSILLPEGIYHVGTDIKPGWYHLSYGTTAVVNVRIGNALNISKTDIDYYASTIDHSFDLWNPTKSYYFYRNMTHTYKELIQGQYIVVENGNVTIEPWDMK